MSVTLHTYYRSSCSWRVRIALNYKGISYTSKPVNLLKNEQKSEEYSKFNPNKVVPSLEIDGHVLIQSIAIIEYLEETRSEKALLPKDPHLRAIVRAIVNQIAADIQPVQNLRVLQRYSDEADKRAEWGKWVITEGFNALEKILAKYSNPQSGYCIGNEMTMADVCLVPQVYNANRFNVDMSKYPNIERIHKHLVTLKVVIDASPENQPDFPKPV
ncbi:glutathione S-transferase [Paraphysoderma sedebokerense]|nr:glutathione S-transferase [Paraphysoderma sedebokerense]